MAKKGLSHAKLIKCVKIAISVFPCYVRTVYLEDLNPISAGGGGGWNPPPSRFFPRHCHKNQPIDSKLSDF